MAINDASIPVSKNIDFREIRDTGPHSISMDGIDLLRQQALAKRNAAIRLASGHSKSLRHHPAMQALFITWYNFGRKHEALKGKTPAMASNLTDHVWTINELIERAAG